MSAIKLAYEVAAEVYRKRYDSISPRVEDVDQTLSLVVTSNPLVVEIGCAYGREAKYILTKTSCYVGIDICEAYIAMAQAEVPGGEFVCVDVLHFDLPEEVDIVFAFASLLHMPKEDITKAFNKIYSVLNINGVVFLSLKRRDAYESEIMTDDLVARQFYYYNQQTIKDCLPKGLVEIFYDEQERSESWFTMIVQKQAPAQ